MKQKKAEKKSPVQTENRKEQEKQPDQIKNQSKNQDKNQTKNQTESQRKSQVKNQIKNQTKKKHAAQPEKRTVVKVDHVSVCFHMASDRVNTLKEFVIKTVTKKISYTEFWALRDVSFEIKKGDVLGIIGRNGAGKSTLLKVISGIMKPTAGSSVNHGNIVPMLELGSGFDFDLSGKENIYLNGAILGYSEEFLKRKYDEILAFSELGDFIEVPLRNYSSGMVMRLAFAIATAVSPEILIVDEILAVGDAQFQEKSRRRMAEMMSGGTTVLFVSHEMSQIRRMCSKVVWLEHGRVVAFGPAKEICDRYENGTEGMAGSGNG